MPFFKDTNNQVHFLDDAKYAHLLPVGAVEITEAEAFILQTPPLPTVEQLNAPTLAKLVDIDAKTIRALREGNTDRLTALEAQAVELRKQLVKQ